LGERFGVPSGLYGGDESERLLLHHPLHVVGEDRHASIIAMSGAPGEPKARPANPRGDDVTAAERSGDDRSCRDLTDGRRGNR